MADSFVIDTSVLIEVILKTDAGVKAHALLKNGVALTPSIVIAEFVVRFNRAGFAAEKLAARLNLVKEFSRIVTLDEELAVAAGNIRHEMRKSGRKFGLSDAIILATARANGAKVITADEDFRGMREAILLK